MTSSFRPFFHFITAFVAGAILPLAFAPINAYPIVFISPAVLLYLWWQCKPWQAFWVGGVFGLGFFGVGASWIYVSIHHYGNANVILALLITLLFIAILALFIATQGFAFRFFFRNTSFALLAWLVFPSVWVVWEWLRSWVLTGFPWLFLGYSPIHSPLRGYAPLIGVYGVSWVIAMVAGGLVLLIVHEKMRVKIISLVLIVLLFFLGAILSPIQWTKVKGKPIVVSLIQGNISQSIKWDINQLLYIMHVYKSETEKHWSSQIIVWPEAAIPTFQQQAPFYFELLSSEAREHHAALILGVPIYNTKNNEVYNGMIVLGKGKGTYLKRHLVPFGEYIPLQGLFSGAMKYFNIPMSDLNPGPRKQPTPMANGISIAPFICYEIVYPTEVLNSVKNKEIIVVISDDSWFGDSLAASQQLQVAQMRAKETGRYVLYATNTGITAVINPQGQIEKILAPDKQITLTTSIRAMVGETPLMRWNYYPLIALLILFLLIPIFKKRSRDVLS